MSSTNNLSPEHRHLIMKTSTLVASLPTKVLREIFIQYLNLPTRKNMTRATVRWSRQTFTTPVTLSHVCHKWRQVACSYPLLWSSIFVFGPSPRQLPLVSQWLKRSQAAPLNIEFAFSYFSGTSEENFDSIMKLMPVLASHHYQWKNICLDLSHYTFPFPAGKLFPLPNISELPRLGLETASIYAPSRWGSNHLIKEVCDQFFWHPSLRSLTTTFQCPNSFVYGPRLKELICSRAGTWSNILDILAHYPNLEILKIGLGEPADSPTKSLERTARPIEHKTLQRLVLQTDDTPDGAIPILQNLTAPKLIELDVPTEDGSIELADELCNMILRSNCRLLLLGELCVDKCPEKYIDFLHSPCLQSLQQLSLNFATSRVLESLTIFPKATQKPLLPDLKQLEVDQVVRPLGHSLSDMLLSRFDTLHAARVIAYCDISEEPLADKLWSHPGYRIIRQTGDKYSGYDILKKYGDNNNPWFRPPLFDLATFTPQAIPPVPLSPTCH